MRPFSDFVRERTYLKNVSPRTVEFYWDCHKSVLRFGDFTEDGLKRWIVGSREAGISPASINTRITGINAYLRWCDLSYKVPFLKEPERVLPTLGTGELTKLIRHKPRGKCECRTHTLALTLVDTGARIEELLTLATSDVDLDNLLLKLKGKGDKERIVPFSLELRKVLFRHLKCHEHQLVFCTRDGGRLHRRNVLRDFKTLCPPQVEMKGLSVTVEGKMSLTGPGKLSQADLATLRSRHRMQALIFDAATHLTRLYAAQPGCTVPRQALFPQLLRIVERFMAHHVTALAPNEPMDALLCSPYYGWLIETLKEHIRPDVGQGEAPEVPVYETNREDGSTGDVDTWTSRDVREVLKSHVNFVVADTQQWEQAAAFAIDTHPRVKTFVKNAGLGFGIPYLHNGQMHEYIPDFLVRFNDAPEVTLILETKGYDPLADVKKSAAERWVAALNAEHAINQERGHGEWRYAMVRKVSDISGLLAAVR